MSVRPHIIVMVLAAALGGCHSCANDHPYVPAEPDAAATLTIADAGIRQGSADSGAEPAFAPAPGTKKWAGEGLSIDAAAQEIALVLTRDFDGDGKTDALAIFRPPLEERKPGSATGQLVFVHGGDNARPSFVAAGPQLGTWPACVATARLEKVGPRSAFAEIGSSCPKAVSERALDVVRLGGPTATIAFDATINDPKDAPALTVDVEVADRDKDGIDDTILDLTLAGTGDAPPLQTKLAFFDRPAGPSRDPEEPDASLKAIATRIVSTKTKTKDMPALVEQMRMLYRAICEEGGAPRITGIHGGSATSCGSSKALEDAGIAEVRALAADGQVLPAFAAADIAQAAPATKTSNRRFEIDKYLSLAAPVTDVKAVKVLPTAVDATFDNLPQWGPLAFGPGNKLLVRKGKTVTRVDADTAEETPAPDVTAWSTDVLSPDGKLKWLEAYQACEGTAFRASFAVLANDQMSEAELPFAPRLGRGCTGHGDPVLAQPISWGARGLEAIVAGRAVLINGEEGINLGSFLDEAAPLGSPRVKGTFATALPSALVMRAGGKWQQLKSSDFRAADLRACTIDENAAHIACVRNQKVILIALK